MKKYFTLTLLFILIFAKSQYFDYIDTGIVVGKSYKEINTKFTNNAVKLLQGMFNNDENKKEVVVKVINQSECSLNFKVEGAENYNMIVPANGYNYLSVTKGSYKVSTLVCNAIYERDKVFNEDGVLILSAPKPVIASN